MQFSKQTILAVLATAACSVTSVRSFVPMIGCKGLKLLTSEFVGLRTTCNIKTEIKEKQKFNLWGSEEDEDDEEDDEDCFVDSSSPLSKGVESVSWLPSVVNKKSDGQTLPTEKDSEILPLFPLGGIVYTPNSEHILNIFEPRYRQMYTDILMNGTKRFAVSMSHPSQPGRFAQMAVLFELQDLKEVSEQTGDRIKYICNHKVTGRVRLHRILNPDAWEARDTYLRVEGSLIDDSGKGSIISSPVDESSAEVKFAYDSFSAESNPIEEKALRDAFADLVELQHELEEDVRFTRASVISLSVKPGSGSDGLWQAIKLWQSFADQRLMARQNELQRDFQEKLQDFLKKEKGIKEDELPSAIGFQDLSPALQKEVTELQKRMVVELQPLVLESTLTMQKILEAKDHTERLQLLRHFVISETKRLNTKKALKGMFAGQVSKGDAIDASIPIEERISDEESIRRRKNENESSSSSSQSSFFSEDDAFQ